MRPCSWYCHARVVGPGCQQATHATGAARSHATRPRRRGWRERRSGNSTSMNQEEQTNTPHTSPEEGHPAGDDERTDRDVGGPTAPDNPPDEDVSGGGPSKTPEDEDLESHE